jgi:hypothetical protein
MEEDGFVDEEVKVVGGKLMYVDSDAYVCYEDPAGGGRASCPMQSTHYAEKTRALSSICYALSKQSIR